MFSNNSNSSSTIFNQLAKQIDAFRRFKFDVELDIKEKEEQLKKFKYELDDVYRREFSLKEENGRLKQELNRLELFKSDAVKKVEHLSNAIQLIKEHFRQIELQVVRYEETNNMYLNDNQAKHAKLQSLEKCLQDLNSGKNNKLQEIKEKFEIDLDNSKKEIHQLVLELKDKNQTINELCSEILVKKQTMEKMDLEEKKLEEKISQLEQALDNEKNSILKQNEKVESLQKQIGAYQLENEILKNSLSQAQETEKMLKEETNKMEKGLTESNETIQKLNVELENLRNELSSLKELHHIQILDIEKQHEEQATKQSDELCVKQTELLHYKEREANFMSEIELLKMELDSIRKINEDKLGKLRTELDLQKVELEKKYEAKMSDSRQTIADLESRLMEKSEFVSNLEFDNRNLLLENKDLNEKFKQQHQLINKFKDEETKLVNQIKNYKMILADRNNEIQDLKSQNKTLESMEFEMQLLKKDYESKCRELESAFDEINDLKQKMDDRKRLPKRENSTKLMSNSKHVRKEIETSSSSSEIPCNQIKKAYSISITEREHISSSNSQLPNFKVSTDHEKDFETDGLIEEKDEGYFGVYEKYRKECMERLAACKYPKDKEKDPAAEKDKENIAPKNIQSTNKLRRESSKRSLTLGHLNSSSPKSNQNESNETGADSDDFTIDFNL